MKKEILIVKKDRTLIKSYFDTFVPSIGDFVFISENEMLVFVNRILTPNSDKICLICND